MDHLKGSLGPLLQAQGAQGDMGKKGVRSESWCQGLPLVGSQIFLHSSGLLLPMAAPPPPPSTPIVTALEAALSLWFP